MLTGGGGLAGIDVADNDHVDVHLFLTARRPEVSDKSIKICSRCKMMLLMSRWKGNAVATEVDSPHDCGIVLLTVYVCFGLILRKES